jgi:hypothetical protein
VEVQLQSWADEFEGLEDQADPTSEGRAFTDEYLKDIQRELDDENLP